MGLNDTHYVLMFDGGSRGNPGVCGCGFVIYRDNDLCYKGNKYVSNNNTNNYAEYMGVIEGMVCAIEHNIKHIHVKGDSLLVINQLLGKWKVKSDNLKPLNSMAKNYMTQFDIITFSHVKRSQNIVADKLANQAMDDGE